MSLGVGLGRPWGCCEGVAPGGCQGGWVMAWAAALAMLEAARRGRPQLDSLEAAPAAARGSVGLRQRCGSAGCRA